MEEQDRPTAVDAVLKDGTPIRLRPICPADAPKLEAGFAELSTESRYKRFLEATDRLTPQQLDYLTHVDDFTHLCWVAVHVDESGEETGLAVARCIRDPTQSDLAEFAVVVADAYHRRGVGYLLTQKLVAEAWHVGVRRFKGLMLAGNAPAIELMNRFGSEISRRIDVPGVVEIIWALRDPALPETPPTPPEA